MIKHVLKTLRSMALATFSGACLSGTSTRKNSQSDAWLFEEDAGTCRLSALPAYPSKGIVTDGEAHRVDMLANTVAVLIDDMTRLKDLMRSARLVENSFAVSGQGHQRLYSTISLDRAISKRLADPVVTDVLFEPSVAQQELDDDLFDIAGDDDRVRTLPAFQIGRINDYLEADLFHSNRSGG